MSRGASWRRVCSNIHADEPHSTLRRRGSGRRYVSDRCCIASSRDEVECFGNADSDEGHL